MYRSIPTAYMFGVVGRKKGAYKSGMPLALCALVVVDILHGSASVIKGSKA